MHKQKATSSRSAAMAMPATLPSPMQMVKQAFPCFKGEAKEEVVKPDVRSAFAYDPVWQLKSELSSLGVPYLKKRCEVVGLSKDEVDERTDRVKDEKGELIKLLCEYEVRQLILNDNVIVAKRFDGTTLSIEKPAGLKGKLVDETGLHEDAAQGLEQDLFDAEFEMERLTKEEPAAASEARAAWELQRGEIEDKIKKLEEQLKEEHSRVNMEEKSQKAAAPQMKQLMSGGRKSNTKFKKAGMKVLARVSMVNALGSNLSRVTIENEELPLGIDWHFQSGRAIIANIREGGSASFYMGGKLLKCGMILKEYYLPDNGRLFKIDFLKMKNKVVQSGKKGTPREMVQYLTKQLDFVGRPIELVFEKPGWDLTTEEKQRQRADDLSAHEKKFGVAIQPLKYVIPKMPGDLGCKWWKTRHGVVLVDIIEGGIVSRPHFTLEGMRPGLVIKEIQTADGHTRDLSGDDRSYHQVVQIITISLRPMILVFDPEPTFIEFTFDVPIFEAGAGLVGLGEKLVRKTAATSMAVTEKAVKQVPGAAPLQAAGSEDLGNVDEKCVLLFCAVDDLCFCP